MGKYVDPRADGRTGESSYAGAKKLAEEFTEMGFLFNDGVAALMRGGSLFIVTIEVVVGESTINVKVKHTDNKTGMVSFVFAESSRPGVLMQIVAAVIRTPRPDKK